MRKSSAFCLLLLAVVFVFAWHRLRSPRPLQPAEAAASVDKRPVEFETRTFDPEAPPADMPPLRAGEQAECESTFLSNASVIGNTRKTDSTHATVTIRRVRMMLGLRIAIWVPRDATEHVVEHEEGHRQISEHYYQAADQVAARVAAPYVGRQLFIAGADLDAQINKQLEEMGREITLEYNKGLNPDPAQLRYDEITDHSRNELAAKDAVAQVLGETARAAGP